MNISISTFFHFQEVDLLPDVGCTHAPPLPTPLARQTVKRVQLSYYQGRQKVPFIITIDVGAGGGAIAPLRIEENLSVIKFEFFCRAGGGVWPLVPLSTGLGCSEQDLVKIAGIIRK